MKCPLCDIEAVITKSDYIIDTEKGKLFRKVEYSCRNKKCPNFNKVIGEDKYELPAEVE